MSFDEAPSVWGNKTEFKRSKKPKGLKGFICAGYADPWPKELTEWIHEHPDNFQKAKELQRLDERTAYSNWKYEKRHKPIITKYYGESEDGHDTGSAYDAPHITKRQHCVPAQTFVEQIVGDMELPDSEQGRRIRREATLLSLVKSKTEVARQLKISRDTLYRDIAIMRQRLTERGYRDITISKSSRRKFVVNKARDIQFVAPEKITQKAFDRAFKAACNNGSSVAQKRTNKLKRTQEDTVGATA